MNVSSVVISTSLLFFSLLSTDSRLSLNVRSSKNAEESLGEVAADSLDLSQRISSSCNWLRGIVISLPSDLRMTTLAASDLMNSPCTE